MRALRRPNAGMPSWYKLDRVDLSQDSFDLDQSLADYEKSQELTLRQRASRPDVIAPLPRRDVEILGSSLNPLMMEGDEKFVASALRTVARLAVWVLGAAMFVSGVLWDKLWRQDSVRRRARRLLRVIQRLGGTFIKLGQQIAMRVDLLPYAYCAELTRLLDKMPAMPLKQAIAAIQRGTGKTLKEIFARFDPEPIGSASIACVYQAVLHSGEKVAVKVRRPGIGRAFAADLRALRWLIGIVEWLAIVRPGNMRNLVVELESSFLEELDLRREAYQQELFRRNSQNKKMTRRTFFSAPRVFFEYTSKEVIVQDFVSGIWLGEILSGLEQGNPQSLARMRELNIDPKIVARRLLWISQWGNLTNVLFHADPHPANVIVQANNHIIMIDFGACGHIPAKKRRALLDVMRAGQRKNVSGMVKGSISMLEPLPRIDLDAFIKDLERVYYRRTLAIWSKQGHWWERTTAQLWLSMMQLSRKYNLPINADTVKGLRATLLYDTMAVRLDHDLDPKKESQRFLRDLQSLRGERMRKTIQQRLTQGLQAQDYAKLDEMATLGNQAIESVKRMVENSPFQFIYSINKPIYAVITIIRVSVFAGMILLASTGLLAALQLLKGQPASLLATIRSVLASAPFLGLVGGAVLVGGRRILFRFNDRDN